MVLVQKYHNRCQFEIHKRRASYMRRQQRSKKDQEKKSYSFTRSIESRVQCSNEMEFVTEGCQLRFIGNGYRLLQKMLRKFAHSYFSEELQAPDQRGVFASTIVVLKKWNKNVHFITWFFKWLYSTLSDLALQVPLTNNIKSIRWNIE